MLALMLALIDCWCQNLSSAAVLGLLPTTGEADDATPDQVAQIT
jgi:hypothetical protein